MAIGNKRRTESSIKVCKINVTFCEGPSQSDNSNFGREFEFTTAKIEIVIAGLLRTGYQQLLRTGPQFSIRITQYSGYVDHFTFKTYTKFQ